MDGISIQVLEKENTKLSFDTQIGEIKVATGLLIRSRPTFLCAPLSIIARANVQGSTDWRRPVIFPNSSRLPLRPHPCLVNPKFHFLSFCAILFSPPFPSLLFIEFVEFFSLLSTRVFMFAENYSRILSADSKMKWWTDNEGDGGDRVYLGRVEGVYFDISCILRAWIKWN